MGGNMDEALQLEVASPNRVPSWRVATPHDPPRPGTAVVAEHRGGRTPSSHEASSPATEGWSSVVEGQLRSGGSGPGHVGGDAPALVDLGQRTEGRRRARRPRSPAPAQCSGQAGESSARPPKVQAGAQLAPLLIMPEVPPVQPPPRVRPITASWSPAWFGAVAVHRLPPLSRGDTGEGSPRGFARQVMPPDADAHPAAQAFARRLRRDDRT